MRRKFDRDAAGVADSVAHALGEFEMVAIAGCQIAAGLGDTDDRPSRLQFVDAETIVQIAFEIECRHIRIVRIVEPGTRPQPSLAFWPRFRPFSHIYPSRCTISGHGRDRKSVWSGTSVYVRGDLGVRPIHNK